MTFRSPEIRLGTSWFSTTLNLAQFTNTYSVTFHLTGHSYPLLAKLRVRYNRWRRDWYLEFGLSFESLALGK